MLHAPLPTYSIYMTCKEEGQVEDDSFAPAHAEVIKKQVRKKTHNSSDIIVRNNDRCRHEDGAEKHKSNSKSEKADILLENIAMKFYFKGNATTSIGKASNMQKQHAWTENVRRLFIRGGGVPIRSGGQHGDRF